MIFQDLTLFDYVAAIPDILEGYPVMIEETGEIRALPGKQD